MPPPGVHGDDVINSVDYNTRPFCEYKDEAIASEVINASCHPTDAFEVVPTKTPAAAVCSFIYDDIGGAGWM